MMNALASVTSGELMRKHEDVELIRFGFVFFWNGVVTLFFVNGKDDVL